MNRFIFRFKSVLRFKEIIEEQKKRDFGTALSHLRHEEKTLENIEHAISDHEELTEQSGQGKICVRELENKFHYARLLDSKKTSQTKIVKKAKDTLESKRTELVESTKKKKIFERLQERDREEYNKEVKKEEQKLNDESSIQRFNPPQKH